MADARLRAALRTLLGDLRRFAYGLSGNGADADDLLQATVVRLLEKGVPDDADIRRWALRVCRNLWIDMIRAKRPNVSWDEAPEAADSAVDGETAAMARIELNQVQAAIAQLPPDQREVLSLVAVNGLSYREAAEIAEVPIGTIMSRLARARGALAERLGQAGEQAGDKGQGKRPGGKG